MLNKLYLLVICFVMVFINGCVDSGINKSNDTKELTPLNDKIISNTHSEVDPCIDGYIESNNKSIVTDKNLAMYDIDYMSVLNGIIIFICNAKYANGELSYKDIVDLLRNINMSSLYGVYSVDLPNQKINIPVINKNISEKLASDVAHFVYMNQNQTVDALLTSVQISLRNPPMTYNYYGCGECFESNIHVKITHSNDTH